MTAFFGLLFLSSFAMRLLDGSAKAYGDGIGSNGTDSRMIDCMFFFFIGDDFMRCEFCFMSDGLMRRDNSQRRYARSTYLNNEEAFSDHVAHSQQNIRPRLRFRTLCKYVLLRNCMLLYKLYEKLSRIVLIKLTLYVKFNRSSSDSHSQMRTPHSCSFQTKNRTPSLEGTKEN